jgi:gliding motility-associated-like protein
VFIEPDITVYVPSAFAPNDTGPVENQTFYAMVQGLARFNMQVYNRWGSLVFESNHPDEAWDGTYNGEPVPEDVYSYIITAIGLDGNEYIFSGTVTLIR